MALRVERSDTARNPYFRGNFLNGFLQLVGFSATVESLKSYMGDTVASVA